MWGHAQGHARHIEVRFQIAAPLMRPSGMRLQQSNAEQIEILVDQVSRQLQSLPEADARREPAPNKWSIAEILGHLIDSAANNHQRFIRAQQLDSVEPYVGPGYLQDSWVALNGYHEAPWPELVDLWRLYNRHLARVIARVPDDQLSTEMRVGSYEPATLGFVIEDYLAHMRHHVAQIQKLMK